MRRPVLQLAAALLVLGAGCASTPAAGTAVNRGDPTLISRERIQEGRFSNAYDVVKGMRADWLSARGPESFRYPTEVQVYLDGVHMGGVQTLQSIPSQGIQYIKHYNGLEATSRWGIDHGRGVIFVSTRVGREGASTQPPSEE